MSILHKGSAVTSILLKQEAFGIFYTLGYDTQALMFKHFAWSPVINTVVTLTCGFPKAMQLRSGRGTAVPTFLGADPSQ